VALRLGAEGLEVLLKRRPDGGDIPYPGKWALPGVLINGLAAVIIGETLIGRDTVLRQLAAPLVGSIIYYQLVSLGLALGLKPADLKLVTGLFVLATLALPALRRGAEPERLRE